MRNLEAIKQELSAAREALSQVEGTPAEVYSRIVGYYRSVRNWNKGKREEYRERKTFVPPSIPGIPAGSETRHGLPGQNIYAEVRQERVSPCEEALGQGRILLFVRPACPACPGAKDAAFKLGIPVDLVNADTAEGFAEAEKRQVMSTPTAIFLGGDGTELGRAGNAGEIVSFAARTVSR